MRKEYQNYIFDLYGTLADIQTDENSPRLWASFSRYLGFCGLSANAKTLQTEYLRLCGEAQRQKEKEFAAKGIAGPFEIDILSVWQAMGSEHGVFLTDGQAEEISRVFRALSLKRLKLFPGAREVLRALRGEGKKVILLSNAQASFTRPELHMLGIDTAFDAVLLSSEAGVKKPSPAFFNLLWQKGLRPEASVMIGNDDVCDCGGAAAVGMDSLYIHTAQSPDRKLPLPPNCHEITALTDIIA